MESEIPGHLSGIVEDSVEQSRCGYLEALVGIDVEDPVASCLLERKVAGSRKIIAPGEMMKLDRKPPRLFDRVVPRSGVDNNDLVGFADERLQAFFDEPGLVADNQRCR
jgi:hypothetical protein